MADLDTTAQLTLIELANRLDPNGSAAIIAEVLTRKNPVLRDAPWFEANNIASHMFTKRLTLPTGNWRKLNSGVTVEASQTQKQTEGIGMLESYSEVDKALAKMAPNPAAFRMSEAKAFIEGMGQTLASTMFYGDASLYPERFTGLAPRMALASLANVTTAGSGTNSIYIVQWGEDKVHMIYPKGHKMAGIEHEDLGEVTVSRATTGSPETNQFQAYRDHFMVYCGMVVKRDDCIARLANVSSTGTFDEDGLIALMNEMYEEGSGSVLYVNSTVKTRMEIRLKDKTNVNYTMGNAFGGPVLMFRGHPVRRVDALLSTETALTS